MPGSTTTVRGDSLQGRYHHYRNHPISYAELPGRKPSDLEDLLQLSSFPEPFFSSSARKARRWSREYASRVLEEDLVSLENVKDDSLLRLVKKESKHYHYDWTVVQDRGIRFENMVACHLLKWCHFQQDYEGRDLRLHFYRDMDGREVDFVIAEGGKPIEIIECKTSAERGYNQALRYLKSKFPGAKASLVSLNGKEDVIDGNGVRLCPAHTFLEGLI